MRNDVRWIRVTERTLCGSANLRNAPKSRALSRPWYLQTRTIPTRAERWKTSLCIHSIQRRSSKLYWPKVCSTRTQSCTFVDTAQILLFLARPGRSWDSRIQRNRPQAYWWYPFSCYPTLQESAICFKLTFQGIESFTFCVLFHY